MFGNINLGEALDKERKRNNNPESFVNEALELLEADFQREQEIAQQIATNTGAALEVVGLDESRIYDVSAIRATCIRYRLRFLDTKYFKGEIPYEATIQIRELERQTGQQVAKFRIMAPARRFELGDCNADPLLFAQLNDGRFYLLHQWGNDMKWYRQLLAYPFRKLDTLVATILMVAAFFALILPSSVISSGGTAEIGYRFVFFLWAVIALSAIVSYSFFTFNQNFSNTEWNSKYFNS